MLVSRVYRFGTLTSSEEGIVQTSIILSAINGINIEDFLVQQQQWSVPDTHNLIILFSCWSTCSLPIIFGNQDTSLDSCFSWGINYLYIFQVN